MTNRHAVRRRCRDRGASATEYAAVLMLVSMIAGGAVLVSPGITTAAGDMIERAIQCIAERENCGDPVGDDAKGETQHEATEATREFTKSDYRDQLCDDLGIDCDNWDPKQGLSCNDENIVPVYEYYADLSEEHSELQWAGMAKLAGGAVYGGMQDLHVLRGLTREARKEYLKQAVPSMNSPLVNALAGASEEQLAWFEDKFVEMQQQIFKDLGWQHAAYVEGGIEEMRRLDDGGELPPGMIDAWEDIASGDPERVQRGNEALLHREQHTILQDRYDEMRDHTLGRAVTYMLSEMTESPIPGGHPFREVAESQYVGVPYNGYEVLLDNVADPEARWEWISEDMLPRYRHMLENEPDAIRDEIDRPLEERSEEFRMVPLEYDPDDGVC